MRVPIRKPGKYTHNKPDTNFTEVKFNELKAELEKLKKIRPEAAREVKRLAEMGDLSENAAYQMAKGYLRKINERISELESLLLGAVIIKPTGASATVQLGCQATIEIDGQQKTYLILGSAETNPGKGVISHNSPIGAALIGRKAGECVKINQNDKIIECRIIKVE